MAAANNNAPAQINPLPFTIDGFTLEANPSEWTPKHGKYTSKRVGSALLRIGFGTIPAEVSVIFPADGTTPECQASLPRQRFAGSLIKPASDLSKEQQAQFAAAVSKLEADAATGFVAWYRQQTNVAPLTSRVVAGSSARGVKLTD